MNPHALDPADPRVGTVLQDRYRILSRLAEGGMGVVYRGERLQLRRQVAIKFLHDSVMKDPKLLPRFQVEAEAMSRISHAHCVSVIDFGVAGSPYLVMDFVAGRTLRETLAGGVLPARRAISIARQVLSGLAHAHAQGIIHRDIKPENIVLENTPGFDDHVRILDFGLAKILDRQANLTVGMVLGTPNYMAPEQIGAGVVDVRTDVYAVGIVLFEMLTGRPPFHHDDVGQVLRRKLNMAPPPLRQQRPHDNHSAELEAVILRALARSPAERFPDAAAMAAALDSVPEMGKAQGAAVTAANGKQTTQPSNTPAALDATAYASGTPPVSPPPSTGNRQRRVMAVVASIAQRTRELSRGLARHRLVSLALDHMRRRPGLRWGAAGGAAVAVVLVVLLVIGSSGDDAPPAGGQVSAPLPARPPDVASEPPAHIAEARSLMRRGNDEGALRLLTSLRRTRPGDAEIAALMAEIYFERRWWSEAVAAHREVLDIDPGRARDPLLVWHLTGALQSSRFHSRAAMFLRELGEPVRPLLERAAREHPSPSVRTRAATLLDGWRSRPPVHAGASSGR